MPESEAARDARNRLAQLAVRARGYDYGTAEAVALAADAICLQLGNIRSAVEDLSRAVFNRENVSEARDANE